MRIAALLAVALLSTAATVSAQEPRGAGYSVEYQQIKMVVSPFTVIGNVSVVFASRPTEKVANDTAIAELVKAVQRTDGQHKVIARVFVGRRVEMRASDGKSISATFDAQTRRVTNAAGNDLKVEIPAPRRQDAPASDPIRVRYTIQTLTDTPIPAAWQPPTRKWEAGPAR